MISDDRLLPFVGSVLVLFLAPGPSVVFVVSRSIAVGLRAGLIAVLGNTLGLATQLIVVLGPGLADDHTLFTILKVLGAIYLLGLGITTILRRRQDATGLSGDPAPEERPGTWALLRQGWIVGITNPKGLITDTSLAPAVIHGSGDVTLALAALGAIGVLAALVGDGAWALAAGTLRRSLGGSPRRLAALNATGGGLMVIFGIVLAIIALD